MSNSLVKIALNLAKHQSICNTNDFHFITPLYVLTNISQKSMDEIRAQMSFLGQKLQKTTKIAKHWENSISEIFHISKGSYFLHMSVSMHMNWL